MAKWLAMQKLKWIARLDLIAGSVSPQLASYCSHKGAQFAQYVL